MNYEVGDKVTFRINQQQTIGEIRAVLEEQNSYRILTPTLVGTRKEVVVPEEDVLGEADFDWK